MKNLFLFLICLIGSSALGADQLLPLRANAPQLVVWSACAATKTLACKAYGADPLLQFESNKPGGTELLEKMLQKDERTRQKIFELVQLLNSPDTIELVTASGAKSFKFIRAFYPEKSKPIEFSHKVSFEMGEKTFFYNLAGDQEMDLMWMNDLFIGAQRELHADFEKQHMSKGRLDSVQPRIDTIINFVDRP